MRRNPTRVHRRATGLLLLVLVTGISNQAQVPNKLLQDAFHIWQFRSASEASDFAALTARLEATPFQNTVRKQVFAQVAKPTPARKATLINEAQAQLKHDDLAGAEKTLWSVLSSDPNNEEALTMLGIIRGRQQRYAEAETLFRRVLQLNPKSVVAYRNLVSALVSQDKIDDAVAESQNLVKLAPEDSSLKVELAQLYLGRGQFAEALASLGEVPAQRFPASAVPVKAASLLGLGRKSEAVALASQAKANPAVALDLAAVFLEAQLPDEALSCLPATVPAAKAKASAYYQIKGKALQAKGQLAPAVSNLRKSLTLEAQSTETLLALAQVYAAQNNHVESLNLLQRAHTVSPDSLTIIRPLVLEALKAGDRKLALRAAYDLQQKSPDNLDDLYLAGATMLEVREYAPTVAIFEKYVAQRPQEPKARLALGLAYIGQQRYNDAKSTLEQATQLDPTLAEAYYQIGLVDSKLGKVPDAIQNFEHVLQLQPRHAKTLVALGTLYVQQGELEKAQDVLQRGAAADPKDPDAEYQLSLLFKRTGNAAEARRHMERFRKLKEEKDRRAAGQGETERTM
jgi:tetratricopeptide (TPR) repeat protein